MRITTFNLMNRQDIAKVLKEKTRVRNIQLPKDIDFSINNRMLILKLSEKGILSNMQEDKSAFEGWAICLRYWLKDYIDHVFIDWDNYWLKSLHYNRFKYRIYKFSKIEAYFLASKLHPLITKDVIDVMNNIQTEDGLTIKYTHLTLCE